MIFGGINDKLLDSAFERRIFVGLDSRLTQWSPSSKSSFRRHQSPIPSISIKLTVGQEVSGLTKHKEV